MNKNNKQIFEPYRLNAATGELTQLFENKDAANPIQGYDFDKDGNLRAYTKMVNGIEMELYYKDLATNEFKLITRNKWDDNFGIISFSYNPNNKDEAYVYSNLDSDKARIILYDFKTNKKINHSFYFAVRSMRLPAYYPKHYEETKYICNYNKPTCFNVIYYRAHFGKHVRKCNSCRRAKPDHRTTEPYCISKHTPVVTTLFQA